MNVAAPLRRAGIALTGFVVGTVCGAAGAGLLVSLVALALTVAGIEVVSRLTKEP